MCDRGWAPGNKWSTWKSCQFCFYPGYLLPGEFVISRVPRAPEEKPDLQCSHINFNPLLPKLRTDKNSLLVSPNNLTTKRYVNRKDLCRPSRSQQVLPSLLPINKQNKSDGYRLSLCSSPRLISLMEISTHDMDTKAFWNLHLFPAHPV